MPFTSRAVQVTAFALVVLIYSQATSALPKTFLREIILAGLHEMANKIKVKQDIIVNRGVSREREYILW